MVKKIGKYVMLLSSTQLYYDFTHEGLLLDHKGLIFLDFTNEGLLLDHKGLIFLDSDL
jgi:hypothetical protein